MDCCFKKSDSTRSSRTTEINKELIKQKINKKKMYLEEGPAQVRTHREFRLTAASKSKTEVQLEGRQTVNQIPEGFEDSVEDLKTMIYSPEQWIKILKNNDLENTSVSELVQSLRHGVRTDLRPMIWDFLTQSENLKKQHAPDYYKKLKQAVNPQDELIRGDVSRTFAEHPFFNDETIDGETLLFNILRAYANHDKEVGYVQGMNSIVGKLLIILEPDNFCDYESEYFKDFEEKYEEKVFWILVYINFEKNWRQVYKKKFPKMHGLLTAFGSRLKLHAPDVHQLIIKNDLDMVDCFHSAFICLCQDSAPVPISKRLFDLFFIEEEKVIFKVLIRAILLCKAEIFEANGNGRLQPFLKNEMLELCYHKYRQNLHILFPGQDSLD